MAKSDSNFVKDNSTILDLVSSEQFGSLSTDMQDKVLNSVSNTKDRDGGLMGKLFGIKKENAAMNIAFTICLILSIVGLICMWCGNEMWNVIIPAIMTAVGYIFGKADK